MTRWSIRVTRATRVLLLGVASWIGGACAPIGMVGTRPVPSSAEVRANEEVPALNVPPGHQPAPGMCRVWFPGRPPGRQPRAVACTVAMANAPAGAWVLYRPNAREVHARVIDARRPGVVVRVHVYAVEAGRYLRTERP